MKTISCVLALLMIGVTLVAADPFAGQFCYQSKDNKWATVTTTMVYPAGTTFKFTYVSGGVGCANPGSTINLSNWGCGASDEMYFQMVTTSNVAVLPDPQDSALTWAYTNHMAWYMSGYNSNSASISLTLVSPLPIGEYHMGHGQDIYSWTEGDNWGEACFTVEVIAADANVNPNGDGPGAVTGFTATAADGKVNLKWTAVNGATKYKILYNAVGSSTISTLVVTGGSSTSAVVDGLTNDQNYDFRIFALDFDGTTQSAVTIQATPIAASNAIQQSTFSGACDIDALNTNLSPYLHYTTEFKSDTFTMVVAVPTSYQFNNFTFIGSDGQACTGNAGWQVKDPKANEDICTKLYYKTLTWENLHQSCGAIRSSSDKYVSFRFNIRLDAAQNIFAGSGAEEQEFAMFRSVQNTLPWIVRFPRYVDAVAVGTQVTNTLTNGKLPGQAAVIGTAVTASGARADVQLDVELLTSLTYPDYVQNPVIISAPTYVTVTFSASTNTNNCQDTAGATCKQFWHFVAKTDEHRCDFSGAYVIQFPLTCKASYTSTCVQGNSLNVTVNLKTMDHCPKITTATLTGELATYSDKDFSNYAASYKLRDFVYGEMTTSSESASISTTTLRKVVMRQTGYDDITMYDTNANTAAGNLALCTIVNSGTPLANTKARFTCKLLPAQVPLPSNAKRTITWYALAEVVFQHTSADGTTVTSRRLLEAQFDHHKGVLPQELSNNNEAEAVVHNTVSNPAVEEAEAMTATVSAAFTSSPSGIVLALLAVFASMFMMM